jgi:oligoribonuclease (3'-5' exoribonuclease)
VKAMKETAKELDIVLDDWLVEHHKMKGLVEKVESDQDFMDMMISMLDGATINGFDADTINKATTLVCMYKCCIYLYL